MSVTSETPRIAALKATSNPDVFQVELRCEVASSSVNDLIGLTLGTQARPRVAWHPVTLDWLEAFGYTFDPVTLDVPGDELWNEHLEKVVDNDSTANLPSNMPEIGLFVKESFQPREWVAKDGSEHQSNPKINPSTGEVMCNQGRPIYRETVIAPLYTLNESGDIISNPEAFDATIKCDGSSEGLAVSKTVEAVEADGLQF